MASRASNKQQQDQRPPTAYSQFASHGRGGAGNMADARKSPQLTPSDLETPVLKEAVVTTGRSGTGNMARNDDPVETRMRQDVEGVPRRLNFGVQQAGRNGAGNVLRDGDDTPADSARVVGREQPVIDDVATDGPGPDWRLQGSQVVAWQEGLGRRQARPETPASSPWRLGFIVSRGLPRPAHATSHTWLEGVCKLYIRGMRPKGRIVRDRK